MTAARSWARVARVAVLVLLPACLTLVLYRVVLTDVGLLKTADDAIFLALAEDGVSACDLLVAVPDSILPFVRLEYGLMDGLFGRWWLPYAWVLLISFAAVGAALGLTVWHLTDSAMLGAAAEVAFVPSMAMSSGVLTHFVYTFVFFLVAAMLAAVPLTLRYARSGRGRDLAAVFGAVLVLLLIGSTSLIAFPLIALVALAETRDWRRLAPLGIGLAAAGLVMAAAIVFGVVVLGNPMIGQTRYGERPESVGEVVDSVLAMGVGGLIPFTRGPGSPLEIVAWKPLLLGLLGVVVAGLALCWRERRARYGLAALACLAIYALIAANGRDRLSLWHARYNIYAVVFGVLGTSCFLAVVVARLPLVARRLVLGAVLVGAVGLGVANARAVLADDYYTGRATLWREARAAPGYDEQIRVTARSLSCDRARQLSAVVRTSGG